MPAYLLGERKINIYLNEIPSDVLSEFIRR